jgi:acyl-CoA thioester hydrolase
MPWGHVNNTLYFRYLEVARIDWTRSIGCQPDPNGQGIVIVNAFCNFIKQLDFRRRAAEDVRERSGPQQLRDMGTMERATNRACCTPPAARRQCGVDFRRRSRSHARLDAPPP